MKGNRPKEEKLHECLFFVLEAEAGFIEIRSRFRLIGFDYIVYHWIGNDLQ